MGRPYWWHPINGRVNVAVTFVNASVASNVASGNRDEGLVGGKEVGSTHGGCPY